MPTLDLTEEQAVELLKQLPSRQQDVLFRYLLTRRWPRWETASRRAMERIREIASECGVDWEHLSEEEREAFVDDIVHEGRLTAGTVSTG
jgi:hypothetical protein